MTSSSIESATRAIDRQSSIVPPRVAGGSGDNRQSRLWSVLSAHALVDVYSAFVPPILGLLEVRCRLEPEQTAWLLGIGSITSGVCQPIAAWLSDRTDSRLFGALGLAMAAVALSCIGIADSFASLLPIYVLGMIGSGVFHPIGAASVGQLVAHRRALGVSLFHVAGMAGGITGSILITRIVSADDGFSLLRYCMIPGLVTAALLHLMIRRVPHRPVAHRAIRFEPAAIRQRWWMVALVFSASAIRFAVNMALIYLFVRWAQSVTATLHPDLPSTSLVERATKITGNLNALALAGMAVGGMSAALLIRPGREKWPLVLAPIVFAPAIALFGWTGINGGYALSFLSGIGFASMVPLSISLAQRLLPHRTSLASGLMMGGAWSMAFIGPSAAEWCLSTLELGLPTTFILTAIALGLSGAICLPLSAKALREAV